MSLKDGEKLSRSYHEGAIDMTSLPVTSFPRCAAGARAADAHTGEGRQEAARQPPRGRHHAGQAGGVPGEARLQQGGLRRQPLQRMDVRGTVGG